MLSLSCRSLLVGSILMAFVAVPQSRAQYSSPPQSYSITTMNSMFAQGEIVKVYRDGSKAVVELSVPPQQAGAQAIHTRTFYDLQAQTDSTQDLINADVPCGAGTFSGDWGDPFAFATELRADLAKQNPAQLGAETVNGFATKVAQVSDPSGAKMKLWIDQKYGLIIKYLMIKPDGTQSTMIEVKEFSAAKAPASVFTLPAPCAKAQAEAPVEIKTAHQVTAAHLDDPPPYTSACPAKFHFTGSITSDGPGTVWFKISAGVTGKEGEGEIKFAAAGTKSVSKDLVVSTSPGAGGGSALLEAAMEDDQGRHGDSTAHANNRFEYDCKK